MSLSKIARAMNLAGYKTPGGRDSWSRHMVFDLLHTRHVQEFIQRDPILRVPFCREIGPSPKQHQ
jgi:hypothetical protein